MQCSKCDESRLQHHPQYLLLFMQSFSLMNDLWGDITSELKLESMKQI